MAIPVYLWLKDDGGNPVKALLMCSNEKEV